MTHEVIITLIKREVSDSSDEYGDPVYTEERTDVFAVINAVKRSEFYQGAAAGLKPEIVFEVYAFEYGGQKTVELDGERYNVIRTYPVKGERLEIICNSISEAG